jgi:serine/threonine protein kinase
MFLEWLEGQTLESHLDRERMTPLFSRTLGEVLALMEQPMAALAAAHERGLVHRDIKPSNFFVCAPDLSPGVPIKMLDFGLAKLQSRGGDRELPSPVAFMTPTHAAPEQFRGEEGWVGPWTDVFGLALVLVEMMRGGGPALTGSDFAALRDASMDTEHRPTPQRFGLEVAGVVEAVFERALAVDPSQRFQTIGEFSDALHAAVERERRVTSSDRSRVCGEIDIETTQRSGLPGGSLIVPQGDTEVARAPKGHLDLAVSGDTVRAPCPVRSGSTVRVDIALVDDSEPSS